MSADIEVQRPDKRFATARAIAALAGATLCRTEDDRGGVVYVVSRWGLTRQLPDLDAVEKFVDRLGGR